MFHLRSVETHAMTRELAERLAAMRRVPGERKIAYRRIAHLEGEIDAGALTTFRWCVASVTGEDGLFRVNGQHTSYIFATERRPVQGTVVLETYHCDSMADLSSLWARFDSAASSRTKNDVLNTTRETDDVLRTLPLKQSQLASQAAAIAIYGLYANKASSYDKAQASVSHRDFVVWACSVFPTRGPWCRVGVFFAALVTYKQSSQAAEAFWHEVQHGTNPNPQSGSRAIQRVLLEYSASIGGGARNGKKTLTWEQTAELCLSAWKSWLSGRDVQILRLSPSGLSRFVELRRGPAESTEAASRK